MQQHFLDLSEAPPGYFSTPHLYRRKPVNDLHQMLRFVVERQWRKVEQNEIYPCTFAHVFGPPGSGKSSASWAWAHHARNAHGCTFASVRCDLGTCHFTTPDGTTIEVQARELERILLVPGGDFARVICVFDQALNRNIDPYIAMIVKFIQAGIGVILVSSESVRLNEGTFQGLKSAEHRFLGWTKEEYSAAIANQPFFDAIKATAFGEQADYADRDSLLDDKFPFAGHSARYMFAMSTSDVKRRILRHVASADAALTVDQLSSALTSPFASGAINSLMSWLVADGNGIASDQYEPLILSGPWPNEDPRGDNFGQRVGMGTSNCFVSHFAGQTWAGKRKAPSKELRFLGMSIGEMSIVGYGFQQRFYEATRDAWLSGAQLSVVFDNAVETWAINEFNIQDPANHLNEVTDVRAGRFFWCVGNTAAYDAVFIYENRRIRFIQVTSGKEHSFKIYSVDQLLRNLENRGITFTHVDFVVVRPLPDTDEFTLKTPVGSLQRWLDFNGTRWQSNATCRDQVRYGKLDW